MKGRATKENGLSRPVCGELKKPPCGNGGERCFVGDSGEMRA